MQEKNGKWLGKLPSKTLEKILSGPLGSGGASTVVGPSIGEDAAIIDMGCCDLVMHVDPITEAGNRAGWLAVHVASNDIAVTGARPRWVMLTILAREGASLEEIQGIIHEAGRAASEIGAEIVGGHTEVTPGLGKTIVQATAIGYTCKGCSVPTSGAKPGDLVLQVKPAGLEGTAIIATDFRDTLEDMGIDREILDRASTFYDKISVVKEALALADRGLVTAMHDPTEGGLLGGLIEIAKASHTTLIVRASDILVTRETSIIAEALKIDPLKLISSGTLIATVPRRHAGEVDRVLGGMGVEHKFIGEVAEYSGSYLRLKAGEAYIEYNEEPMDEITRVIEKYGKG
ncbi:MAG: AIR synthase family protein [Desulfurococcales archaeon]|nr:AIR synthase family protein [Desulfurococcales archaeon]